MGRNTKLFEMEAANAANRQRQLIASAAKRRTRRNAKADAKSLLNPQSAMPHSPKTRHHARSGVIRYGDEAASFGATKTDRQKGLAIPPMSVTKFKDTKENFWLYCLKFRSGFKLQKITMNGSQQCETLVKLGIKHKFSRKLGGYVVTEQGYETLLAALPANYRKGN